MLKNKNCLQNLSTILLVLKTVYVYGFKHISVYILQSSFILENTYKALMKSIFCTETLSGL